MMPRATKLVAKVSFATQVLLIKHESGNSSLTALTCVPFEIRIRGFSKSVYHAALRSVFRRVV
jgi:hypothetical protein